MQLQPYIDQLCSNLVNSKIILYLLYIEMFVAIIFLYVSTLDDKKKSMVSKIRLIYSVFYFILVTLCIKEILIRTIFYTDKGAYHDFGEVLGLLYLFVIFSITTVSMFFVFKQFLLAKKISK